MTPTSPKRGRLDEASQTLNKQASKMEEMAHCSQQLGAGWLVPMTGGTAAEVPWGNLMETVVSFLEYPIIDGTLNPKK